MSGTILIVDDEKSICENLKEFFKRKGHRALVAHGGASALKATRENNIDMVLLDLGLPDMEGLDVLEGIKKESPGTCVIIFTGNADIGVAVKAMQMKADNFVTKPIDLAVLYAMVEKCQEQYQIQNEIFLLKHQVSRLEAENLPARLGRLSSEISKTVRLLSESPSVDVLILGETGTGKGFLAKAIHDSGEQKTKPFVEINCAELGGNLLESELFGHEKGAFTDARTAKRGLLEVADGGTVFLDEVGEMSLAVQAKLLKVIETRTFRRLGGIANLSVKIRLMAATNTDLEEAVKEQRFRKDLYYRLNIMPIQMAPLRERREDILPLAMGFLGEFRKKFSRNAMGFSGNAESILQNYAWPGNIRELRNVIERAMLLSTGDQIEPELLPESLQVPSPSVMPGIPFEGTLAAVEKIYIGKMLEDCNFNQTRAAKVLGIHRSTLIKKIKEYGLGKTKP